MTNVETLLERTVESLAAHGYKPHAESVTVGEWFDANPDASARVVWAADAKGGFGKKGWPVYGNNDDLEIIETVALTDSFAHCELLVWNPAWGQI